jgi:hypothetical protein
MPKKPARQIAIRREPVRKRVEIHISPLIQLLLGALMASALFVVASWYWNNLDPQETVVARAN